MHELHLLSLKRPPWAMLKGKPTDQHCLLTLPKFHLATFTFFATPVLSTCNQSTMQFSARKITCVLITWCKAFVSFLALCHTSSEWNISRRAGNVSTKIKWKTYNYSTEWFYNETTPHFSSQTFRRFSEPAMKKFRLHYSLGPSNCS